MLQPFLIKIVLGQLLPDFITLKYLSAASLSPKLNTARPFENLSIEVFITELISLPAHQNSKNMSTPLHHLFDIGYLELLKGHMLTKHI